MAMNRVLRIPKFSDITGASSSNCSVSHQDIHRGGLTPLQRCSWCILDSSRLGQTLALNNPRRLISYQKKTIYIYIYILYLCVLCRSKHYSDICVNQNKFFTSKSAATVPDFPTGFITRLQSLIQMLFFQVRQTVFCTWSFRHFGYMQIILMDITRPEYSIIVA